MHKSCTEDRRKWYPKSLKIAKTALPYLWGQALWQPEAYKVKPTLPRVQILGFCGLKGSPKTINIIIYFFKYTGSFYHINASIWIEINFQRSLISEGFYNSFGNCFLQMALLLIMQLQTLVYMWNNFHLILCVRKP